MNAAGCLLLNIHNNNVFSYKNFQLTQTGYKLNKNHEWRWRFVSLSRMGVTHTFSAVCCSLFSSLFWCLSIVVFFLNWITKFQLRFQHYTQLFFLYILNTRLSDVDSSSTHFYLLLTPHSTLFMVSSATFQAEDWNIQKRNTFVICFLILLIYTFFSEGTIVLKFFSIIPILTFFSS